MVSARERSLIGLWLGSGQGFPKSFGPKPCLKLEKKIMPGSGKDVAWPSLTYF